MGTATRRTNFQQGTTAADGGVKRSKARRQLGTAADRGVGAASTTSGSIASDIEYLNRMQVPASFHGALLDWKRGTV